MSDDGTKRLPPGGVRLPEAVRELALAKVEECLLRGMRRPEILAHMAEMGATESMRTVDDWIAEVRKRLIEADIEHRDFRRNLRRAQLEARYQLALADLAEARGLAPTAAKYMAISMLHRSVAQIEALMIKIDGLDGAIKADERNAFDPRAMSPEQRRERIAALLAKRAATQKAAADNEGIN